MKQSCQATAMCAHAFSARTALLERACVRACLCLCMLARARARAHACRSARVRAFAYVCMRACPPASRARARRVLRVRACRRG
eukprot:2197137-Pleurochrysis_carterae.AAC.1